MRRSVGGAGKAAPADVPRKRISGRPRVTVRPNYVGLPSMAGRGPDERGRKPCGIRRTGPPSGPGSTVPKPKIAAVERRKATRLGVSARPPGRPARRAEADAAGGAFRRSASLGLGAGTTPGPWGFYWEKEDGRSAGIRRAETNIRAQNLETTHGEIKPMLDDKMRRTPRPRRRRIGAASRRSTTAGRGRRILRPDDAEARRTIMTLLGMPRRCREPACRPLKRCAGADLRCQRDFPPPMTEAGALRSQRRSCRCAQARQGAARSLRR